MWNDVKRTFYWLIVAVSLSGCAGGPTGFHAKGENRAPDQPIVSERAAQDRLFDAQKFMFRLGYVQYIVTNRGDGLRIDSRGATRQFLLPLDEGFEIEYLYYFDTKEDLILVYGVRGWDSAGGDVARLDRATLKCKWLASVPGFNVGESVIKGRSLYLTAIGFVGKLDLDSGSYVWQYDNLYKRKPGTFNSFQRPVVEEDVVEFTEELGAHHEESLPVTIVVEDRTGRVLNPW